MWVAAQGVTFLTVLCVFLFVPMMPLGWMAGVTGIFMAAAMAHISAASADPAVKYDEKSALAVLRVSRMTYVSRLINKMLLGLWLVKLVQLKLLGLSWAAWILGIIILESGITLLASADSNIKKNILIFDHSLLHLGFVCLFLLMKTRASDSSMAADSICWAWIFSAIVLAIRTGRKLSLRQLLLKDVDL